MAKRDILPIFPSRANSVLMKHRVLAGKRGVNLLKRKRDAIDMKLRDLKKNFADMDEMADDSLREAIFSMAKANLLGTDFKPQMVGSSRTATTFLRKTQMKIVGVTINVLELETKGVGAFPLAGLSCGGIQVNRIREAYLEALKSLTEVASLEYQIHMLEAASRQTNMRVNALEHVVIPILQNTYNYIQGELEEFEREDFYRLKRSQAKQLEAKMAFTELIKTKNMTDEELEVYMRKGTAQHPVADYAFDDNEFQEEEVKRRIRTARRTARERREADRMEAEGRGEAPKPTSFITTRSLIDIVGRKRDPRVSSGDLYSTKRMLHASLSSFTIEKQAGKKVLEEKKEEKK
ncbi:uncharacterized protein Dana_GF12834 [Drosophila ananassae]|uniref:Uncharacterized protein n=1 Tax=Drosophila ananassae TaxID=7217 RepID=B3MC94_DROAN|nr:V-type proton ATPase subunit D [Drosophila ananassae]EDV36194.1 uncharacterized protein Dana_GF12834 [Drosophila ananassae]